MYATKNELISYCPEINYQLSDVAIDMLLIYASKRCDSVCNVAVNSFATDTPADIKMGTLYCAATTFTTLRNAGKDNFKAGDFSMKLQDQEVIDKTLKSIIRDNLNPYIG